MDRRTFLTRFPLGMAGGVASLLPGAQMDDAKRQQLKELLASAEQHYAHAQDLVHWPYRYDEARPLLETAAEAAAEAWLRQRGIEQKLKPHYSWLFMAVSRPDDLTGIAWHDARTALKQMTQDCDLMARFFADDIPLQSRYAMITRSRATLVRALKATAGCIEATRREMRRG